MENLTCDLHRHLDHWMRFIGLYLGTKYKVCRWNSIQDITSSLGVFFFTHFWENLTLIFDLDRRPRALAPGSLNALYWVVPWCQVWSLCFLLSWHWELLHWNMLGAERVNKTLLSLLRFILTYQHVQGKNAEVKI